MNKRRMIAAAVALAALLAVAEQGWAAENLEKGFINPPRESQAWCYWWWLNGNASKEGIIRDMEEMKSKGINGALLFEAGWGGPTVPSAPGFMSEQFRELFRHAVREADRCGIVLSVNMCPGVNAGGPWVLPKHAMKRLVSTQTIVQGAAPVAVKLATSPGSGYVDIAVLAAPLPAEGAGNPPTSVPWDGSSAVDVTKFMAADGMFRWDAPPGAWRIQRIGYVLAQKISSYQGGPQGWQIDPMSAEAMDAYFAETGAKLIADAGPLAGKTLQYFHVDSWEFGPASWTDRMREEFQRRRGYDLLPWLPAVLGTTVNHPGSTARFIQDYRHTAADLFAANYYGRLRELTLKGGLRGTHPESGGPGFNPWIDALQCEGINDIPMGEFWKRNHEPDSAVPRRSAYDRAPIGQIETDFSVINRHNCTVKQAACAAHIFGKPICQAEAFTSFACDWIEGPWEMKDIGDAAFCEGLTRNVLCFWVHQPRLDARPGFQWAHCGTHFDSNLTWWPMADGWLTYLARCQHMLRQGLFVADIARLQRESIPSFIPPRPGQIIPGYDYDAMNAEVLLSRASAKDGCLLLPDGMSYRYLVLPQQPGAILSPATLKKVNELAEAGVAVIGSEQFSGSIAKMRKGKVGDLIQADGLAPDIEFRNPAKGVKFDWIHRRDGDTDIYFLCNQSTLEATADVVFRVAGKQPELWDAVTGGISDLPEYRQENNRTLVPMKFAPRQSWFVVFNGKDEGGMLKDERAVKNFPETKPVVELTGAWVVQFDPQWFYPDNGTGGKVRFEQLTDWTQRPEEAIKFYSGIATYRKSFDVTSKIQNPKAGIFLDLGEVKNVARVRLNGRDLGVVWTAPWQVEITGALKAGTNDLEIEVANLWPNRLIGDGKLPKEKRRTVTNVLTYEAILPPHAFQCIYPCPRCTRRQKTVEPAELLSSGLLGPVRVMAAE